MTAPTLTVPDVIPDMTTLPEAPVSPAVPAEHADVWALVQRAQAGDAQAFAAIYQRYRDMVFRYIYFRVGNRPLAEDLAQDVWARGLKRIGSFTWQGRDFGAWLITIARNLVADHFKSQRYQKEIATGDVLDADTTDEDVLGQPETVLDDLMHANLAAAVQAAMAKLTPEQRQCLQLRYFEGLSLAQTADAMGSNTGAMKALQLRATRSLGAFLAESYDLDGRIPLPRPSDYRKPKRS